MRRRDFLLLAVAPLVAPLAVHMAAATATRGYWIVETRQSISSEWQTTRYRRPPLIVGPNFVSQLDEVLAELGESPLRRDRQGRPILFGLPVLESLPFPELRS